MVQSSCRLSHKICHKTIALICRSEKVMFSVVSVCHSVCPSTDGPHVTIVDVFKPFHLGPPPPPICLKLFIWESGRLTFDLKAFLLSFV